MGLFLDLIEVGEARTNAALEFLCKATHDHDGDIWLPMDSPLLARLVELFTQRGLDPADFPAVLVNRHAPFTWGKTPCKAVDNAVVLEFIARMALETLAIAPGTRGVSQVLLDKHFLRKHGPGAYYGQAR